MSSVSFSNYSLRAQELSASSRLQGPYSEMAKRGESVELTAADKVAEPSRPEAAQPVVTLPGTVDMRFEFNALTQAWMLAMTDASSGDVVRKIALKGFSGGRADLQQAGHWIDRAV